MKAVILRNRTQQRSNICHTHDFCDANMVLHAVFLRYDMDVAEEGGFNLWGGLWNETWNLAKANEFRPYNRHRKYTNWWRIIKSA